MKWYEAPGDSYYEPPEDYTEGGGDEKKFHVGPIDITIDEDGKVYDWDNFDIDGDELTVYTDMFDLEYSDGEEIQDAVFDAVEASNPSQGEYLVSADVLVEVGYIYDDSFSHMSYHQQINSEPEYNPEITDVDVSVSNLSIEPKVI